MKQHWNRSVAGSLLIHILLLSAVGLTAGGHLAGKPEQIIPVTLYEGGSPSSGLGGAEQAGVLSGASNGAPLGQEDAAESDLTSIFKELERPETTAETGQQNAAAPSVSSGSAASGETQASGSGSTAAGGAGNGTGTGEGGNGSGSGVGTGEGGTETETDLSRPASLISYSKNYPSASRRAGETGSVTVGVTVGKDGSVTEAWIVSGSGYNRLDEAALQSAYGWRFRPALNQAGEAVEGEKRVRVVYNLQD